MDSSRFASLEGSIRVLKTWNVVLTILLIISLGANAAWVQAASDPPVRVYSVTTDDAGAGGHASASEFPITSAHTPETPLTLITVPTSNLRDHDHICLVTASAQVEQSGSTLNGGIFLGLSRGNPPRAILEATKRTVYIAGKSNDDADVEEATITFVFKRVRRHERINFAAYWGGLGALTVVRPSMTVVCLGNPI